MNHATVCRSRARRLRRQRAAHSAAVRGAVAALAQHLDPPPAAAPARSQSRPVASPPAGAPVPPVDGTAQTAADASGGEAAGVEGDAETSAEVFVEASADGGADSVGAAGARISTPPSTPPCASSATDASEVPRRDEIEQLAEAARQQRRAVEAIRPLRGGQFSFWVASMRQLAEDETELGKAGNEGFGWDGASPVGGWGGWDSGTAGS